MSKSERPRQTTVEEGSKLKGTLSSTCPVVVRGVLEGDIDAPELTVEATGAVTGNVRVQVLRSEGSLAGSVDADDVSLSGKVKSDTVIRAKRLEVKLERESDKVQVTFGDCVIEVGDDPRASAQDDTVAEAPAEEQVAAEAAPEPAAAAEEAEATADKGKQEAKGGNKKANAKSKTEDRPSVAPPSS